VRAALLVLLAGPCAAQEFVALPAQVSDEAFYRAVACAAPPGGECRKPYLRWPQARRAALGVGLVTLPGDLPDWRRALFEDGLSAAVAQVNALGAGVTLTRDDPAPAIAVHVVDTPPGGVMTGTGEPTLDGALLPLARVALRARDGVISEAVIAISAETRRREVAPVLLEEVVQALGLMTDVSGPAHERSLFAERGNSVARILGRDAMAIRRHYADEDRP
jgi:hypothetical protein